MNSAAVILYRLEPYMALFSNSRKPALILIDILDSYKNVWYPETQYAAGNATGVFMFLASSWDTEKLVLQSMEDAAARELLDRYHGVFVNAAKNIFVQGIEMDEKVIWLLNHVIVSKRSSLVNMVRSPSFQALDEETRRRKLGAYLKRICSNSGKISMLKEFKQPENTVSFESLCGGTPEDIEEGYPGLSTLLPVSRDSVSDEKYRLISITSELDFERKVVFALRSYGFLEYIPLTESDWKTLEKRSGLSEDKLDEMLDEEIRSNCNRDRPISSRFVASLLGITNLYVDKLYQRAKEDLQNNPDSAELGVNQ